MFKVLKRSKLLNIYFQKNEAIAINQKTDQIKLYLSESY